MGWLGFLLGALAGAYADGFRGLVVGAAAGTLVGLLLRGRAAPAGAQRAATDPLSGSGVPVEPAPAARLAALERRVAALEAALAQSDILPPMPPPRPAEPAEALQAAPVAASVAAPAKPEPPLAPVRKGVGGEPAAGIGSTPPVGARSAPAATPSLWSWFTDGKTMVRVGVVVLFFGIAFLLSYLAEHVTVPIELQFAGVAFAGAAMIGVGLWLRRARRAYALALLGGGFGVLYLTTYAAFELVPLLSPASAFALLAAIAALAIVLSLLLDAQGLAALAALGGLLAPVLVATVSEPLLLFGYVAAVNALILGVAWFRAWRAVDLVGFVGTFVLGQWWGYEYFEPASFAVIEPFLAAFFLAYVAVPLVHALRGAGERRIDAVLVFGVPMVAFALQAELVEASRYGLAWTAAAVAAVYALLWAVLSRRASTATAELSGAFGALAVIFATLALPFAVDAQWTSATWALEAVGIYWIGCRDDRRLARGFALLLQAASGGALLLGGFAGYAEPAFANRQFLGCAVIALAGLASVRFGDRRSERLPAAERSLLHVVFGWACVWWLGAGLGEMARHVATRFEGHAMLAWIVGSVTLAALLARPLRWPRLEGTAVVLLPALALSLGRDLAHGGTSLGAYGWAVYPAAWVLHAALLHRAETVQAAARVDAGPALGLRPWLAGAHLVGALMLVGQIAWEAGEWTSRVSAPGTVWAACAQLLPLALYLLALEPAERLARWPLHRYADAYAVTAATIVAILLGVGFVALALLNPGDPRPLPYVPLVNPLDLMLLVALAALFRWGRNHARLAPRALERWLGFGAFVVLSGIVARSAHYWLGVPWQLQALIASRPLQAALTLTWTIAALATMVTATRRQVRALWYAGAGLLAVVVIKLFVIDLAALSGLSRVVAFLGVGALLLVIGYVAPLPPLPKDGVDA